MERTPEVTTADVIMREPGYRSLQPVSRPPYWGVDLDFSRRPGVPMEREPKPWPNSRFPPVRQFGQPAVPKHGRTNRQMPPVFGTSTPLKGLSGAIRRAAYRLPDHKPAHWVLKLLGDRVDSMESRAGTALLVSGPFIAMALLGRRIASRSDAAAQQRLVSRPVRA